MPPATYRYEISAADLARLGKSGDRHKYDYGHAVILSGPAGHGGAARLAARAALRVGAGLVSVFCDPDSGREHAARLDAIMVKTFADEPSLPDALMSLRPAALCIGPNLGMTDLARAKLDAALSCDRPICLDADAITLIAADHAAFAGRIPSYAILTPHEGELRRLIPVAFDHTDCRATLAQTAADTIGCTVLFKGVQTLIAQPGEPCLAVEAAPFRHAPWLATAGSGDVLAGLVTGLLARGFATQEAGALGATLHLQCAEQIGPGLIADDLPDKVPTVLAQLLATTP
jgi:hydroxyethylthiazole kinase-like uncharacterized protein yjeF